MWRHGERELSDSQSFHSTAYFPSGIGLRLTLSLREDLVNHEAVVAHGLEGALEAKVGGARLWPSIEALPVPLRETRVPLLSSVEHVGCIHSLIADAPREGLIRMLFGEV
jgi:hypothetical protein